MDSYRSVKEVRHYLEQSNIKKMYTVKIDSSYINGSTHKHTNETQELLGASFMEFKRMLLKVKVG